MHKFVFLLFLCPLMASAQITAPRFDNDTLYTTSGYKIYKGQIIQLASGTGEFSKFRFIKFQNAGVFLDNARYQNTSILVKKLYDFKISGLGNRYIGISGTITYGDGSKSKIEIDLNFERAINNFAGLPSEIIVPEEFRNKGTDGASVVDEIERLFMLYKEGALTKAEYETLKKKVIEKN